MHRIGSPIQRSAVWSSRVLLLQTAALFSLSLAGCNQGAADFSQSATDAPSLETRVSDAEQAQAKQLVQKFTTSVEQEDDAAIRKMMSPQLSAKVPKLSTWKVGGVYSPLLGAKNWRFNLIRYAGRGKTLVVHTDYLGTDGGNYRTNFAFRRSSDAWVLDQILPPTKPTSPTASQGKMSSQ